ncbi:phosphate-starvation-inducible E [Pseudomonas lundensis]|nr:phosphate-starvation-inducible E [Pseudomonas lundensis]
MRVNKAEKLRRQVHELAESMGNLFVETFHYLALFAIGAVTAWAAVMEFLQMVEKGNISIDDILLLFIYLELGAMVGIYFKTKVYVTNNTFQGDETLARPENAGAWCA